MKYKYKYKYKYNSISGLCFLFLLLVVASSCSESDLRSWVKAPGSSIERQVKGHEQISSIQAILRLSRINKHENLVAYGLSSYTQPPIPVYQQIDLSKDENGNVVIKSDRKVFDVVKLPKDFLYTLELKYYDVNGMCINHQFSSYDENDLENSTLIHHQHFFSIQDYDLNSNQVLYPMRLDSTYYENFLLKMDNGKPERAGVSSSKTVYIPDGYDFSSDAGIKYDAFLAQKAVENALTPRAIEPLEYNGKTYHLYKALGQETLNSKTPDLFEYWYLDTDPVEEPLFKRLHGYDDLNRLRIGIPVGYLQKKRALSGDKNRDYLGFKGEMLFYQSNVIFQMRICICHIMTNDGKYTNSKTGVKGKLNEYNEISPAWNTFDIDYPLSFRVIADLKNIPYNQGTVDSIRKYYPDAKLEDLQRMFDPNDPGYFRHFPQGFM